MIIIKVKKNLHTEYGDANLNIDLEIQENRCTAIFGESGAGKTTILRMLAGLTTPDSGLIKTTNECFYDSNLNINMTVQERNIGFVFQDYALFPNMTVERNILFALKNKKDQEENREYIEQLISIMELKNLVKKYPHEISGGQKQRVALARALARKPKILLLDEPLSALDNKMRNKLQEYLLKLMNHFSFTSILVSHDLQEVKALAHQLVNIKDGKIVSIQERNEFTFLN